MRAIGEDLRNLKHIERPFSLTDEFKSELLKAAALKYWKFMTGENEKEIENMCNIVKAANPQLTKKITDIKGKDGNINGSVLSWYCQNVERQILEVMKKFYKKKIHSKRAKKQCSVSF